MAIPSWKLRFGIDGGIIAEAVGSHHMPLQEGTEVVLKRDYDWLMEEKEKLQERWNNLVDKINRGERTLP